MRQRRNAQPVSARHRFGGEQGIQDSFFGCQNCCSKDGIEVVIGQDLHATQLFFWGCYASIGCGKSQEDVSTAVATQAAGTGHAERGALGHALELIGEEWRIRCQDNDQRTLFAEGILAAGEGSIFCDVLAHWDACYSQLVAAAKVGLHQRTNRVTTELFWKFAGCCSSAALKLVTDHACSATNVAFGQQTGLGGVQSLHDVFGFDVKAVHVVEPAVR